MRFNHNFRKFLIILSLFLCGQSSATCQDITPHLVSAIFGGTNGPEYWHRNDTVFVHYLQLIPVADDSTHTTICLNYIDFSEDAKSILLRNDSKLRVHNSILPEDPLVNIIMPVVFRFNRAALGKNEIATDYEKLYTIHPDTLRKLGYNVYDTWDFNSQIGH